MKQETKIGFADLMVSGRKIKDDFFKQVDKIIDWKPIDQMICKYYKKGTSVSGRPSYDGLVLFKMCLLQTWYGLSDYELEDQVNDRISFSKFVGLSLEDSVPDHSVISRFRSELTKKRVFEKIFQLINQQLESANIIVRTGVIVDASITDSPRKPKGKKVYEAVEDRKEDEPTNTPQLQEKVQPGVDTEARWIKKAGKLRYGYKKHVGTDPEGLVLGVVTTPANESDITHLDDILNASQVKKGMWVKGDKGYKSENNDKIIRGRRMKNHIMHKAKKNLALTERQNAFNKLVSKTRFKVERTFGSIKRWFNTGTARYIGLDKMHTQNLIESMAYNLYRSPGIIMSNCQK